MPGAKQGDAFGNGAGGVGVIAGDHDRADAGVAGLFERGANLGSGRVNHPNQTNKNKVLLNSSPG